METKLTLKLDRAVIQAAKRYAEENERSLSGLVEDYFRNLSTDHGSSNKYSPLVEELIGVISDEDIAASDYTQYLGKKYE